MFWQSAFARTINLPEASNVAYRVDGLHDFLWWMSIFFLALITFGMLVFIKKYHRSVKGRETEYILGSHKLEALWTFIPLILMLFIFAWGYRDYRYLRTEMANSTEINVVGRQWLWNFEYANGRKTMNELYLPKGKPVKLIMTSDDVLHSFYMPNFRLKQDLVPGSYTYITFVPTMTGIHPIYCAEFCGTGHSDMRAKIIVLEPKDFEDWLATGKSAAIASLHDYIPGDTPVGQTGASAEGAVVSMADKGKALYQSKGCFACHTVDGTPKVGPSFKGAYGRTETLSDDSTLTVDENYIRESLMEPQKKIVKGFPPSMPTFKGLLTEDEINALIAYIKSLK